MIPIEYRIEMRIFIIFGLFFSSLSLGLGKENDFFSFSGKSNLTEDIWEIFIFDEQYSLKIYSKEDNSIKFFSVGKASKTPRGYKIFPDKEGEYLFRFVSKDDFLGYNVWLGKAEPQRVVFDCVDSLGRTHVVKGKAKGAVREK